MSLPESMSRIVIVGAKSHIDDLSHSLLKETDIVTRQFHLQ